MLPEEKFKEFKKKGVPVEDVYLSDEQGNRIVPKLEENEFVILKADQSARKPSSVGWKREVIKKAGIPENPALRCFSKKCRTIFRTGSTDAAG